MRIENAQVADTGVLNLPKCFASFLYDDLTVEEDIAVCVAAAADIVVVVAPADTSAEYYETETDADNNECSLVDLYENLEDGATEYEPSEDKIAAAKTVAVAARYRLITLKVSLSGLGDKEEDG